MEDHEIDVSQIMSLQPRVVKAIRMNELWVREDDNDCKSDCCKDCGCYGYKPCTCDSYEGCPKE